MEHRSYIHKEAGESSLRCTCGTWKGKHPTDTEGFEDHALANRPAFIAVSQVIAAAVMRGELRFTVKRGAHLGLAEDQLWCATDLCERLLATVEPHLAAEGRDAAADRLDEVRVLNGERAWPFVTLLREDADRIRSEHEKGLWDA